MAISGIDAFQKALFAQQFGSQFQTAGGTSIGGTRPVEPERVGGVGTEIASTPKFDWRNLNRFDGALTGTTPQAGVGKTSEVPTENIFAVGAGAKAAGTSEINPAYNAQANGLVAALNAIDAKDIGLNSNKNGFQGQRYINFMA